MRFGAALVGGVCAGTAWTAGGFFFTRFVASSTQTALIYAGFAIVILALIWIYVSWMILLLGAQIAFYVQHPQSLRAGHRDVHLGAALCERLGLTVMYLVARDYQQGTPHWTLNDLSERFNVPASALKPVIQSLESNKLLVTTDDEQYLPGRDPGTILLTEIFDALRQEAYLPDAPDSSNETVPDTVIRTAAEAFNRSTGNRTLAEMLVSEAQQ